MRIWSLDCPESETKRQRSERILLDLLKDGDLGRDLKYVERLRRRRNGQTSDAMENIFDFFNCGVQRWDDDAFAPMITYRPRYIRYPRTYFRSYPYYSSLGWNMNTLNPFADLSSLGSPYGHVCADPLAFPMMNNVFGGLPAGCLAGGFCPWQRLMRMAKYGMGPLGHNYAWNGGFGQNGNMVGQGMGPNGNMWNQGTGVNGNMWGQGIGLIGNMGTQGIGFDGSEGMLGSGNKDMDELMMRRGWQAARDQEERRRQERRDAEEELYFRRLIDQKWTVFKHNPQLVNLVEALQNNGFGGLAGGLRGQQNNGAGGLAGGFPGQQNNGLGGLTGGYPGQHAEQNPPTMPRAPRYAEDEELSERRPRPPRRRRPRYDSPAWDDGYGMPSGRQGAYYGRRQGHGRMWGGNNRFDGGGANSVLDEDSDLGISEEGSGHQFSHPRGRPAPDQRRGQRRHHHDFGSPFDGPPNRRAPYMDGGFPGAQPRMRRPGNAPGQRSSNERRAPST